MAHSGPLSVLALTHSSALVAAVREACAGMNGTVTEVRVGTLAGGVIEADPRLDPDVLFLELGPGDAAETERLQRALRTRYPHAAVVATAAEASLDDVRRLMRLGVVDFVPQPIVRADLAGALLFAAGARQGVRQADPAPGKVVAFLKAGGGAGATTLAVHAGCALALDGKAQAGGSVCLLDLDVQLGAAALFLDLDDRVGLGDLLETPERLDPALLRSVMARHDCGLEVLAAPRELIALDSLTPEYIAECLELARREYRVVLIDLPGVWTPWTLEAVRRSDALVLVAQLTVSGIRQARRQLDTLRAQSLDSVPVRLALNRYRRAGRGSVGLKDAERALGRRVDHLIANDYRTVSAALDRGVPLWQVKKRSKVGTGIRRLVEELTLPAAAGAAAPAGPRG